MLNKPVMFIFLVILFLFFFAGGVLVVGGVVKQYQLFTQAHTLANIMARYGYFNETAEESLEEFCKISNINRNELTVNTIPASPYDLKTYGEIVSIEIIYPYKRKLLLGDLHALFNFEIKTSASAVSTCVPGLYVTP